MAKNKGFISVERAFLASPFWLSEPFTKPQAWLDLIGLANFEPSEEWKNGRVVKVPRGSLLISCRELAARWRWTHTKVWRFLRVLENERMITTNRNTNETLITIEKYGFYQTPRNTKQNTDETRTEHEQNTREIPTIYINKETKKQSNKAERENDDISEDPRIIGEFVDPRTGEERIIIRP